MATAYSDIFDLFMTLVDDYRLVALYQSNVATFETYVQSWLIFAIVDFQDICDQDLTDRNDTTRTFNIDLTDENKVILSELMVKYWLNKEVQDKLQMNLTITDSDFKHYAESQNYREKNAALQVLIENTSQRLLSYEYKKTDWTTIFEP